MEAAFIKAGSTKEATNKGKAVTRPGASLTGGKRAGGAKGHGSTPSGTTTPEWGTMLGGVIDYGYA